MSQAGRPIRDLRPSSSARQQVLRTTSPTNHHHAKVRYPSGLHLRCRRTAGLRAGGELPADPVLLQLRQPGRRGLAHARRERRRQRTSPGPLHPLAGRRPHTYRHLHGRRERLPRRGRHQRAGHRVQEPRRRRDPVERPAGTRGRHRQRAQPPEGLGCLERASPLTTTASCV